MYTKPPAEEQAAPAIRAIREQLFYEIFRALRMLDRPWQRHLVSRLIDRPVQQFAQLACKFEQNTTQRGFAQASREILPFFTARVETTGEERIPQTGPLIIASNHPGSLDVLLLSSFLYRDDIRMVARDMPFLRSLPGVDACLIYSTRDHVQRATVLRQALRHLDNGGALLLFPSGNLDPDPACFPGAAESLDQWTASVELFLRRCPQTQIVLAVVSGVIAPLWLRHPLVRFRRQRWDRQFSAELLQTLTQVLFPRRFRISPRVCFDGPIHGDNLNAAEAVTSYRQTLIRRARELLDAAQASQNPLLSSYHGTLY